VDNDDFDEKFSLAKTLTSILDSSSATTNNSSTQLLNSLLDTFIDLLRLIFNKINRYKKKLSETNVTPLQCNTLKSCIVSRGVAFEPCPVLFQDF
jgi:hypothetical protein